MKKYKNLSTRDLFFTHKGKDIFMYPQTIVELDPTDSYVKGLINKKLISEVPVPTIKTTEK